MDEKDIWRSAQAMVTQHGDDAKIQAGFRSDACLEKGDLDGAAVWRRVIQVIGELQNTTPGDVH